MGQRRDAHTSWTTDLQMCTREPPEDWERPESDATTLLEAYAGKIPEQKDFIINEHWTQA